MMVEFVNAFIALFAMLHSYMLQMVAFDAVESILVFLWIFLLVYLLHFLILRVKSYVIVMV